VLTVSYIAYDINIAYISIELQLYPGFFNWKQTRDSVLNQIKSCPTKYKN